MWQEAAERLLSRTLAVVSSVTVEQGGAHRTYSAWPQGTAFLVCSNPLVLVTNEHVVTDDDGDLLDDLRVGPFGGDPEYQEIDHFAWADEIDFAVLVIDASTSDEPTTLWAGDPLPTGTPVASLGFPAPQTRDTDDPDAAGVWQLSKRLTTGYVSQAEYPWVNDEGEPFPEPVYELSALVYGGNSGGPCFDREGRVVGMMMSSVEQRSAQGRQTLAFAHAIRSDLVIGALDALGVEHETVGGGS